MAAHAEDRTETPTPRRRSEARTKGQVARSHDLTAAAVLVVAFFALKILGPKLWGTMLAVMNISLSHESPVRLDELPTFVGAMGLEMGKQLAPLFAVLFVSGIAVLFAQVGWLFTLQPLMPSLAKINPLSGLARLFSIRSVMTAMTSFAKLILVAIVAYVTIAHGAASFLHSAAFGFHDVVRLGCALTFELGMKLSVALLILALLDYAWQRFRHERDMRMTKEEVKDELRSMEGDPHIKRRRRQLQLQLAMQRLRKDVPKVDVVVTNPTHLAVAIAYDSGTMMAPKVVAKGADEIALRIRQIAAEFGIPIVERKPLARAVYDAVEVGQYIPESFYRAIAEILAYIYELTGRSKAAARGELVGAA